MILMMIILNIDWMLTLGVSLNVLTWFFELFLLPSGTEESPKRFVLDHAGLRIAFTVT